MAPDDSEFDDTITVERHDGILDVRVDGQMVVTVSEHDDSVKVSPIDPNGPVDVDDTFTYDHPADVQGGSE